MAKQECGCDVFVRRSGALASEYEKTAGVSRCDLHRHAERLLRVLEDFPMLMIPPQSAWGHRVQEWQEEALEAISMARGDD